jgi:hypothetical protein
VLERSGHVAIAISGLVKRSFGMLFFKHQNTSLWYARRQGDGVLFPTIVLITTNLVINGLRTWFCTGFFLKSVLLTLARLHPADIFNFRGSPRSWCFLPKNDFCTQPV